MSCSSSEELRTRAIEAIAELLDEGGLTHPQTGPRSELVAKDLLAAAEPFIRELVIGEVVGHIRRSAGITTGISQHVLRQTVDQIEAVFGGSR